MASAGFLVAGGSPKTQGTRRPAEINSRYIGTAVAGIVAAGLISVSSAFGASEERLALGEDVFKAQCAACHVGGGNIIPYARGKNLKLKALTKNKMDTPESIINLMKSGKGAMPKYAEKLDDDQLDAVARFVLDQAAKGWQ